MRTKVETETLGSWKPPETSHDPLGTAGFQSWQRTCFCDLKLTVVILHCPNPGTNPGSSEVSMHQVINAGPLRNWGGQGGSSLGTSPAVSQRTFVLRVELGSETVARLCHG